MTAIVAQSTLKPAQQVLVKRCVAVRESAYCPYSKFKVGAAVQSEDGAIYTGVNVENVAFSLAICAERVAMGAAVASGRRKFKTIAVAAELAEGAQFVSPCGLCRQFMTEFGDCEVILVRPSDPEQVQVTSLRHLLPLSFQNYQAAN